MILRNIALALLTALSCLPATAAEGVLAARNPVTVYDSPAESGRPLYLLSLDYPLVILSRTSAWLTVCMHDDTTGYVSSRDVKPGQGGIVTARSAVRSAPEPHATVVFTADEGLTLAVIGKPIGNWIQVRHVSGREGYISTGDMFAAATGDSC